MTLLFLYLFIAIGVSFLCSVLEAVLLSVTPGYLAQRQQQDAKAARQLTRVKLRLDESLASILILNTFAHTMGAAGVGSQALQVFGPEWETLIAVLLTLSILYFSEIIPKTIGATYWQQLAASAAWVIIWLTRLVFPLVWISTRLTKLFGRSEGQRISREELLALATMGHKFGTLAGQENEYLSNVLTLRDVSTRDILTPRSVVHMVQAKQSVTEALNDPKTRQFTRMPVYDTDMDDIHGKVIRADLFEAERDGHGDRPISDFIRPLLRVSGKLPVQKLLDLLIKKKMHLCLVEDEFGQTEGVVSLEDAIETLLGREIVDERDTVEDMQAFAREQYRDRLRESKSQSQENES